MYRFYTEEQLQRRGFFRLSCKRMFYDKDCFQCEHMVTKNVHIQNKIKKQKKCQLEQQHHVNTDEICSLLMGIFFISSIFEIILDFLPTSFSVPLSLLMYKQMIDSEHCVLHKKIENDTKKSSFLKRVQFCENLSSYCLRHVVLSNHLESSLLYSQSSIIRTMTEINLETKTALFSIDFDRISWLLYDVISFFNYSRDYTERRIFTRKRLDMIFDSMYFFDQKGRHILSKLLFRQFHTIMHISVVTFQYLLHNQLPDISTETTLFVDNMCLTTRRKHSLTNTKYSHPANETFHLQRTIIEFLRWRRDVNIDPEKHKLFTPFPYSRLSKPTIRDTFTFTFRPLSEYIPVFRQDCRIGRPLYMTVESVHKLMRNGELKSVVDTDLFLFEDVY